MNNPVDPTPYCVLLAGIAVILTVFAMTLFANRQKPSEKGLIFRIDCNVPVCGRDITVFVVGGTKDDAMDLAEDLIDDMVDAAAATASREYDKKFHLN